MNREDYIIHIIGAGVSGLVAALVLEENGYNPIIIESSDRVGGRVKTDVVKGYQLDHGFQVLLDAYPMAKKYLNFDHLKLQRFMPGAAVFNAGKSQIIGDPLRENTLLWSTLMSNVGSIGDKIKIFKLSTELKKKTIDQIFSETSTTSIDYLRARGFSEKIIHRFFKPFFTGIFLEDELRTSSCMFQFVYKMFAEGHATLPKNGIGEIPNQLKSRLKQTQFIFNSKVKEVLDDKIVLSSGDVRPTHFTILACDPSSVISNLKNQKVAWKSCWNLYFLCPSKSLKQPIIGLLNAQKALINNIFYHTSLDMGHRKDEELLSVTVVRKHQLNEAELVEAVIKELQIHFDISNTKILKVYHIPKALPDLRYLQYDMSATASQLKPTIFCAGDYLLNGSLNAAMLSGERAAEGLILRLEDGLVVDNLNSEYIH